MDQVQKVRSETLLLETRGVALSMRNPRMDPEYTTVHPVPINMKIQYRFFKRTIDVIGALVGIALLLLLILIFSFFYCIGPNKGSIFFKQTRVGQNGKAFQIYKFRSMVTGAEELLKKDELLFKKYTANNFKIPAEEDPRITSFGRFIRKTSLDEIPQFLNVLKGEMSLVGPRPIVESELVEYFDKKNLLLSAKPGITGYWQVCGRSDVKYPERADLELHYVEHQSIKLDILILAKTVGLVLQRKGAY